MQGSYTHANLTLGQHRHVTFFLILYSPSSFERLRDALKAGEISAEYRCHYARLNERQVPVFLSGILAGHRVMDEYSMPHLSFHP